MNLGFRFALGTMLISMVFLGISWLVGDLFFPHSFIYQLYSTIIFVAFLIVSVLFAIIGLFAHGKN